MKEAVNQQLHGDARRRLMARSLLQLLLYLGFGQFVLATQAGGSPVAFKDQSGRGILVHANVDVHENTDVPSNLSLSTASCGCWRARSTAAYIHKQASL